MHQSKGYELKIYMGFFFLVISVQVTKYTVKKERKKKAFYNNFNT